MSVSLEDIEEMAYAITLGEKTPPSKWNQEESDAWKELFGQINEIKAKGGTVDIPMETPG
mgnify:FL=1|jgi:hypothetical protein|tara:strand:+ start:2380 stop:2559 length:180 start_codon:yes stop_codon:yes gene_type:complete